MEHTKAPETNPSEEWADLPWRKLEHHLYRLQKRIAESLGSWRSENCSPAPEIVHEVSACPTRSRSSSDSGEPRQEDGRNRWSQIRLTGGKTCPSSSYSPETDEQEETQAAQACLDTKTRKS
jgi:hypothetical protein